MKHEVFDASEVKPQTRQSPADKVLEELGHEYKKLSDVAKEIGVHHETLRRLCRTNKVNAPSKATQLGGMTMFLFTPEDVEEVRNYFENGRQAYKIQDNEKP